MEGVKKRRVLSKKTKKGWRKTNVRDVEEFLEERRREERVGGPASEKPDKDLYFIERGDDGQCEADLLQTQRQDGLVSLRCETNLRPASRQTPPSRKRTNRTQRARDLKKPKVGTNGLEETLCEITDSSDEDEYERDSRYAHIRKKQATALAATVERRVRNPRVYSAMRDLWAESTEPKDIPDDHYLKVTRKKPVQKPHSMKKPPSLLVSVEPPPPGASYNPTFEDHQDLLRSAVSVEERKLRAAERLDKKMQLTPMDHHQRERVWLEEMTAGLFDGGEDEGEEEGEEEGEVGGAVGGRPVRAEDRKLRKERRKERERREKERRNEEEKTERMRMADVYRLKNIKKDIVKQEMAIAEKNQRRQEAEKEAPYQTRRLGKHIYEEPDIDVQLSSELVGSLRLLKPEGSIAMDRFKRYQKRNIIEPRKRVKPFRKYKLKEKQKRSARLPEEGPVY